MWIPKMPGGRRETHHGQSEMKLKEAIWDSIEGLDNDALALLYEQIQRLKQVERGGSPGAEAPSLDEVLRLTGGAPGSWSEDVIADRAERG